jgi:hypothetical protein
LFLKNYIFQRSEKPILQKMIYDNQWLKNNVINLAHFFRALKNFIARCVFVPTNLVGLENKNHLAFFAKREKNFGTRFFSFGTLNQNPVFNSGNLKPGNHEVLNFKPSNKNHFLFLKIRFLNINSPVHTKIVRFSFSFQFH